MLKLRDTHVGLPGDKGFQFAGVGKAFRVAKDAVPIVKLAVKENDTHRLYSIDGAHRRAELLQCDFAGDKTFG